jgi:hypothetical protein
MRGCGQPPPKRLARPTSFAYGEILVPVAEPNGVRPIEPSPHPVGEALVTEVLLERWTELEEWPSASIIG